MTDWTRFKNAFRAAGVDQEVSKLGEEIKALEGELSDLVQDMRSDLSETAQAKAREQLAALERQLEEKRKAHLWRSLERDRLEQANADLLALEALTAKDGPLERAQSDYLSEMTQSLVIGMDLEDLDDELETAQLGAQGLMESFTELSAPLEALESKERALDLLQVSVDAARRSLTVAEKKLTVADTQLREIAEGKRDVSESAAALAAFKKATAAVKENQVRLRDLEVERVEKTREVEVAKGALDKAVKGVLAKEPPSTDGSKEQNEARAQYVENQKALKAALLLIQQAELSIKAAKLAKADHEERVEVHERRVKALKDRVEVLKRLAAIKEDGLELGEILHQKPFVDLVLWGQDQTAPQLAEQLGAGFADFANKALKVMMGLETVRSFGATDEDIKAFYEACSWPENWLPPFLRKQEQNWVAVKELLETEDSEKSKDEEASRLREGLLALNQESGQKLLDAMQMTGTLAGDNLTKLTDYAKVFSAVVTLGTVGAELKGAMGRSEHDGDPVEHLMKADEAINAVVETGASLLATASTVLTTTSVVKTVTELVPGLDSVRTFTESCQNAIHAANLWMSAMADAKVHEQAKREQHRAEGALDKVQSRGKHVASRKTAKAAAAVIEFAASICAVVGVAAPVALALKASYVGVSLVTSASAFAVDATEAQQARALLKRAQAGDPVAREEIFRHHGRYACALIAVLAEEGDPMALAIFNNHKISKDMVVRSSAKVLKRYLMRELVEEDEPTSWSDIGDWFTRQGESLVGFFERLVEDDTGFEQALEAFGATSSDLAALNKAEAALVKHGAKRYSEVQQAVDDTIRVREASQDAALRAKALDPSSDEGALATAAMKKWDLAFGTLKKKIEASSLAMEGELTQVLELLGAVSAATTVGALNSTQTTELKRTLIPQLRAVADQHRVGLKRVAQAA